MINKLIGGVAVLALVVAGIAVFKPAQVVEKTIQTGAVSSPDILSPYFSFGGVKHWAARTDSLTQATTTVCALQSPVATSSLVRASITFQVSSTTATTVTFATSTSAFATTTLLISNGLAANSSGYVNFAGASANVMAPNTWFVVGMAGGNGNFSPTGTCQATWVALQ